MNYWQRHRSHGSVCPSELARLLVIQNTCLEQTCPIHCSAGAHDNATVRTVFVIGPDKKIKLQLSYPMTTGRNFQEILRVLDSLQLTAKHQVATPADWNPGDDVIISGSVSNEDAKKKYPGGWKAPRPYLRIVPQPK